MSVCFKSLPTLTLGLIFFGFSSGAQEKKFEVACIGFYNVENLFDTADDTLINDEEYLPEGANRWTEDRYREKLAHMSQVISQLGADSSPDGALVIGLAEIENRKVVEDLIMQPSLKAKNFGIVHYDGPDRRGVDVGLIYRKDFFSVESSRSIRLVNPADSSFRTRDQLLVSGNLRGERIHIMVAHWPSRRGGEKASAPLRMLAAQAGRRVIDSILNVEPQAKIIYMGDLNDDPVNKSLTEGLRAKGSREKLRPGEMFNTMHGFYKEGIGTLAYQDAWNLFDQLVITQAFLIDEKGFRFSRSRIFNKPFVRQQDGNFDGYPWRTFVGGRYDGGYSDHFAVYLVLLRELR
jgi:hypothetical protein